MNAVSEFVDEAAAVAAMDTESTVWVFVVDAGVVRTVGPVETAGGVVATTG